MGIFWPTQKDLAAQDLEGRLTALFRERPDLLRELAVTVRDLPAMFKGTRVVLHRPRDGDPSPFVDVLEASLIRLIRNPGSGEETRGAVTFPSGKRVDAAAASRALRSLADLLSAGAPLPPEAPEIMRAVSAFLEIRY